MSLSLRTCIALLCCAFVAAASAQANPPRGESARQIEQAYRAGERDQALQRLDRAIEAQPRDAQLRFLKAVLLAEQGSTAQASEIYLRLTQEYPELPEPYNNLAVLYAAQGQFDKARDALETALRNDPGYATAHENLGDVYVRLALQSYERAGTAGTELQRKLQLARQLAARSPRGS
jgi:Flp pilus assembly protein TadD